MRYMEVSRFVSFWNVRLEKKDGTIRSLLVFSHFNWERGMFWFSFLKTEEMNLKYKIRKDGIRLLLVFSHFNYERRMCLA